MDLRAYVYLDRMQPQFASFIASTARGYLPVEGEAALFVEIAPGIAVNRLVDIAVKSTAVRPGMLVVERQFGMLEVHSPEQAEVQAAGKAILAELGVPEARRYPPHILSTDIIRKVDSYQAQLVNRFRYGNMLVAGQNLYILEVEPAAYASLAANEAEKAARISLINVQVFGRTGRLYLGGEESDIIEASRACLGALEQLECRAE